MKTKQVALLYLIIPFIIFCFGWLKWYYSVATFIVTGFALFRTLKYYHDRADSMVELTRNQYAILAVISLLVSWLNGVGGYWSQSSDWMAKNPLLNDLSTYSWPLIVCPEYWDEHLQAIAGTDSMAFVYYLFYFLPAGLMGQLFGIAIARLSIFIWTACGLFIFLSLLAEFISQDKKLSVIWISTVFLFWGGFDIIGQTLRMFYLWNPSVPMGEQHLYATWRIDEWCRPYFTYYAANWTSLFWCFNQSIPIWIIVILLIDKAALSVIGFLYSFSLLYSPWGAMGMAPLVVYYVIRKCWGCWLTMKSMLNVQNVVFPLLILVIVGSFYMSNRTSLSEKGWYWKFLSHRDFWGLYFVFIVIELGAFFVVLKEDIKNNLWLQGAYVMLLVIPLYKMTHWNDWLMRASIPSLSVVCCCFISRVNQNCFFRNRLFSIIVTLGSFSAIQLIFNSFSDTIKNGRPQTTLEDESFVSPKEEGVVSLGENQFYAHDYENTFFWKYLAKKN